MKIGFDAKRAFLNNTGLGNYSRWLIKVMALYHPQYSYYLYTPKTKPNQHLSFLKALKGISIRQAPHKMLSSWWRSRGIVADLKKDGIELYHGLSHELPWGIAKSGIKSVVTVHDLIFMRFPQYFGWINRVIYKRKLTHACQVANMVIAISERTRQDLVELLQVDAQKIEVIYQGCDEVFSQPVTDAQKAAVKEKYHLPDEFLLSVGTIEERKNLLLAVQALLQLQTDITLVVVGKPTDYFDEVLKFVNDNHLNDQVQFLHGVSFAELPVLYQMAKIFLYPSRYEGFGIPILEALNSGVPVIAAKGSCLEEAGGPHSLYVHADDAGALASCINRMLADEALRNEMIAQGKRYARQFADETLAAQLLQLYKNVLTHA